MDHASPRRPALDSRPPAADRPAIRGLGRALLVLAAAFGLVGLLGSAALAIPGPPQGDGSCTTIPTTYPGNGVPVPDTADCTLVTDAAATTVAEVWTWRDDQGLHWYNYVVDGYTAAAGTALTMCGTADPAAEGVVYSCTTQSHLLLFTASSLFAAWSAPEDLDLHYCETIDVVDPAGVAVEAAACGTIGPIGGSAPTQPPSTSPSPTPTETTQVADDLPPTQSAPPTTQPAVDPIVPVISTAPADPSEPVTEPVEPASTSPPGDTDPDAGGATVEPPVLDPLSPREPPVGVGVVEATPDDQQMVALVEGARFPVTLVLVIAGVLATAGVGVLIGPSLLTSRRRRL